jgi:hypothetical protein
MGDCCHAGDGCVARNKLFFDPSETLRISLTVRSFSPWKCLNSTPCARVASVSAERIKSVLSLIDIAQTSA